MSNGNGPISGGGVFSKIIVFVIVAACFWLVWWLIQYLHVPEPFNTVLNGAVAVLAVVACIDFLLGFAGKNFIKW